MTIPTEPQGPDPRDSVLVLPNIGPKTQKRLAEVQVRTVQDLLLHIPSRYEDRRTTRALASIKSVGESVLVRATVSKVVVRRVRRRLQIVNAELEDETGTLPVVWFNRPWLGSQIKAEVRYSLYGQVREKRGGKLQLVNPEINEIEGDGAQDGVVPVYSPLGPLSGRRLRRLITLALQAAEKINDPLPKSIRARWDLPHLRECFRGLHCGEGTPNPEQGDQDTLVVDREGRWFKRLVFDEFLALIAEFRTRNTGESRVKAPRICVSYPTRELASRIVPFRLTSAQHRVIGEISADMAGVVPMMRLLQGDVGSGKTVVAAVAMLQAVEAGFQAALMAPTELLAEQHWLTLRQLFESTGLRVDLLTSSCRGEYQKKVRSKLENGAARLVVGTHSLIQSGVSFKHLGLSIIDEQHRFGVTQRQALAQKGEGSHVLVMTATPIPRSLAMTIYGGLAVSVIDELPPGRSPVETSLFSSREREMVLARVSTILQEGGQGFVVCPLIEPSSEVTGRSVMEMAEAYQTAFPQVRAGVLHGRMDRETREKVYSEFRSGEIQLLVATTVIEVGIDVPAATFMVVESAQRFGLAQLHQLRGRVGRAQETASCYLLVDENPTDLALRRLETMTRLNDGFEIAEVDLEIRGQGELLGTQQWGRSGLRFGDLLKHFDVLASASETAALLAEEGKLEGTRNRLSAYHIGTKVEEIAKTRPQR